MISLHSSAHSPPFYFVSGADRDEEERDRHASESRAKELRPLRILIVEDEFFISLSTEAMLEMLGHMVVGTAVSADEAEQMAKQEQPDVVLMDIRLIGSRDGIDAAAAIHDNLGIRSIFVTANTDPHTRQRALAANPLGFIEKPLSDRRLRDALSEVD